jgi:hypothetical protein
MGILRGNSTGRDSSLAQFDGESGPGVSLKRSNPEQLRILWAFPTVPVYGHPEEKNLLSGSDFGNKILPIPVDTDWEENPMKISKIVSAGARVLAVCLVFALCLIAGTLISGMNRAGQNAQASSPASSASAAARSNSVPSPAAAQSPNGILVPFCIYCLCAGAAISLMILRSRWSGWKLSLAMFAAVYGFSCVVNAIDAEAFLSGRVFPELIRGWLLQSAITAALCAPFSVFILGKWRTEQPEFETPPWPGIRAALWKTAVIVVAFVFFYMFFGYFVAWRNPALRLYYGGPEYVSFLDALKGNLLRTPWIYPLAAFRGLLYLAFAFPLVRMFRGSRWQSSATLAFFLSAWTTALLLPNPIMPPTVAHSHFVETLGFSVVMGVLMGVMLAETESAIAPLREVGTLAG